MGEVVRLPLDPLDNPCLAGKSFTHAETVMFWSVAREALQDGGPEDWNWALRFIAEAMANHDYATKAPEVITVVCRECGENLREAK